MTYTPHRDERFHDMWQLMKFIEENQCRFCVRRKAPPACTDPVHAEDYPMCYEVEADIIAEDGPVKVLDDCGDDGVVCTWFKLGDPPPEADPDQLTLI